MRCLIGMHCRHGIQALSALFLQVVQVQVHNLYHVSCPSGSEGLTALSTDDKSHCLLGSLSHPSIECMYLCISCSAHFFIANQGRQNAIRLVFISSTAVEDTSHREMTVAPLLAAVRLPCSSQANQTEGNWWNHFQTTSWAVVENGGITASINSSMVCVCECVSV